MGRIPIDLRVDYSQRNPEPTSVPGDFGMGRFRAVQERAAVIGKIGGQVADIATEYAAKNKQADLRADNLAFNTQLQSIQSDASQRASQTDDPNEIRQIWDEAHSRIGSWISGKNEKGVPNIRWNDQRGEMISAGDALKSGFQTSAERRIAEVGKRNSNAKAMQARYDGKMSGNPDGIIQGVTVMRENGTYTAEEAKIQMQADFVEMDMTVAKNNIVAIEGMEPAKALAASLAFEKAMTVKEKDGKWSAFEHLPDGKRSDFVNQAKKAAADSQTRFKAQQAAAQAQSNGAVVDFFVQNGRAPTASERAGMGLTAETVQSLESGQIEKISPELEEPAALQLRQEMLGYNPAEDVGRAQQLGWARRIEGFTDPGVKKFLRDNLERATTTDANDVDSRVKTQIEDALGKDFKTGWEHGWSKDEKLIQIDLEKSVYDQWVKKNDPSPVERLQYTTTGRFADLKRTDDLQRFKTTLQRSFAAPAESGIESVRQKAQGQYSRGIIRQIVGVRRVNGVVVERVYDDGTREAVK